MPIFSHLWARGAMHGEVRVRDRAEIRARLHTDRVLRAAWGRRWLLDRDGLLRSMVTYIVTACCSHAGHTEAGRFSPLTRGRSTPTVCNPAATPQPMHSRSTHPSPDPQATPGEPWAGGGRIRA